MKLVMFLLLSAFCYGQILSGVVSANGTVSGGAPPGVTLISHGLSTVSGIGASLTSSAMNTTGASLLAACVNQYSINTNISSLSDSAGNTWHQAVSTGTAGIGYTTLFYTWAPTTSASHTFTYANGNYTAMSVMAFSGTQTSSDPKDQTNGGNTAGTGWNVQLTGSVTPATDGQLLLSCAFNDGGETHAIDSSFVILDDQTSSSYIGEASAWRVQTTAGAINPNWTFGDSLGKVGAIIATFKAQ